MASGCAYSMMVIGKNTSLRIYADDPRLSVVVSIHARRTGQIGDAGETRRYCVVIVNYCQ